MRNEEGADGILMSWTSFFWGFLMPEDRKCTEMVITIYDTLLLGCTVFHGHKVGMVLLYFQVCLLQKAKVKTLLENLL